MKKIKIITPYLSGNGGTETVLGVVLTNSYINSNLDLAAYFSGGSNVNWIEKYKLNHKQFSKCDSSNKVIQLFALLKNLITSKDDAIIAMSGKIVFIAYLVRTIFFKKYQIISWIHFSIFDEPNVSCKYLHFADKHLAISSGIINQLTKIGISKDKCKLIYNPINVSNRKNKFDQESHEIVFIGRPELGGQKNLKELFSILDGLPEDWHMSIYGSGNELVNVKEYISDFHQINNQVDFMGWVPNPWEKISKATVLMLTSKYEGFPMVLLEALSYGIPVISTDCPVGPADIVQTGVNGFLYKIGDTDKAQFYLKKVLYTPEVLKFEEISQSVNIFSEKNYEVRFVDAIDE
ncbi:glycosyltransferase [Paucilactobacillus nenjiangensis]|uniref:glycosyltransferase n=1 Tax=Paucilactobacillus nenjiangensis TaxID=1296540 RepID=UPI0028D4E658|nr:glycosyltransferase [Paucilactobacillus nenjiangensis]